VNFNFAARLFLYFRNNQILPDGKTCEEGVYLRAKIIRCVEGLDQVLYDQAMDLVRSRHVVDPGR